MMKRKYLILCALAALPAMFLLSNVSVSDDSLAESVAPKSALETSIADMPYNDARSLIMADGWKPYENRMPADLMFLSRALYDDGFVEVDVCSPVANSLCVFFFENEDGSYLKVFTEGEAPRVVAAEMLDAKSFLDSRPPQ